MFERILRSGWVVLMAAPLMAAAAPKIQCAQPEYDFGQAASSSDVIHDFEITNAGDEPLEIKTVRTSCGCTAANVTTNLLQPGGKTAIQSKLSLRGRKGAQQKTITVESNDPDTPAYTLQLRGTVMDPIEVDPASLFWGQIQYSDVVTGLVRITVNDASPVQITKVEATSGRLAWRLETNRPGFAYSIEVISMPPMEAGNRQWQLQVSTDHADYPAINIPISAAVMDYRPLLEQPPAPAVTPAAEPAAAQEHEAPVPPKPIEAQQGSQHGLYCAKPMVDLGIMDNRIEVFGAFILENRGKKPAQATVIDTAPSKASCGCKQKPVAVVTIEPGDKTKISLPLPVLGLQGLVVKTYRIESDDPDAPPVVLILKGEADPVYVIRPMDLLFGPVTKDTRVRRSIDVSHRSSELFVLKKVTSTSPYLTTSIELEPLTRAYRIWVETAPIMPVGPVRGEIEIQSSDALQPLVKVPVWVDSIEPVQVEPPEIGFETSPRQSISQAVILRGVDRSFGIPKIETSSPEIKAQLAGVGISFYRLLVEAPADAAFTGGFVRVETTLPIQPEIRIPIRPR